MVIKLWVEKTLQKQMPFRLPRAISFQRCGDDSRGSRNSETRAALLHSGRERLVLDKPDNVAHFEEHVMTAKHPKRNRPTNTDIVRNPLIGGSKGVTMAQARLEDLEALQGENTVEGDFANDTNPQGGIDKEPRHKPRSRRGHDHGGPSRRIELQGKKTHEQQLRILERKPDVPDARQVGLEIDRLQESAPVRLPKRNARQSEFPVSRGGLNQESQHNKHNRWARKVRERRG
jgi:hypothetical protein